MVIIYRHEAHFVYQLPEPQNIPRPYNPGRQWLQMMVVQKPDAAEGPAPYLSFFALLTWPYLRGRPAQRYIPNRDIQQPHYNATLLVATPYTPHLCGSVAKMARDFAARLEENVLQLP